MTSSGQNFDYDYWRQLAENDLAGYFRARHEAIEAYISSMPTEHQERLRQMQRMIDATRAEAGTPSRSVRRMMGMMSEHLDAMKEQLLRLRHESSVLADTQGRSGER